MNFSVPVDLRVKTKEIEKIDKYLDLARELKQTWNMKKTGGGGLKMRERIETI